MMIEIGKASVNPAAVEYVLVTERQEYGGGRREPTVHLGVGGIQLDTELPASERNAVLDLINKALGAASNASKPAAEPVAEPKFKIGDVVWLVQTRIDAEDESWKSPRPCTVVTSTERGSVRFVDVETNDGGVRVNKAAGDYHAANPAFWTVFTDPTVASAAWRTAVARAGRASADVLATKKGELAAAEKRHERLVAELNSFAARRIP